MFVHVPDYYNFNVGEILAEWKSRASTDWKFWLERARIVFFESELALISEFLFYIFTHVDLIMGYNSGRFDVPFLISRCNYLHGLEAIDKRHATVPQSRLAMIHRPFFTSITISHLKIPPNPDQAIWLRNTTNSFTTSFSVACNSCKTMLDISNANDHDFVSCQTCRQSQRVDLRELVARRKSGKNISDSLVCAISKRLLSLKLFLTCCLSCRLCVSILI